jgi:PPOX class probable F420-dependent enzyme
LPVTLEEAPTWAGRLLETTRVARLGLLDESDRPRVLPVTFTLFEGALWSAIDQKPKRPGEPARVRRLRRRPDAALLVDVYDDDWSRLAWVEVRGAVSVEPLLEQPLAALAAKYPQYHEQPPPGPLLRLAPDRVSCWRAAPG